MPSALPDRSASPPAPSDVGGRGDARSGDRQLAPLRREPDRRRRTPGARRPRRRASPAPRLQGGQSPARPRFSWRRCAASSSLRSRRGKRLGCFALGLEAVKALAGSLDPLLQASPSFLAGRPLGLRRSTAQRGGRPAPRSAGRRTASAAPHRGRRAARGRARPLRRCAGCPRAGGASDGAISSRWV